MRSQYLGRLDHNPVSPQIQNPTPPNETLLYTKLASLNSLVTSLNAAVQDLGTLNTPQLDDQFDFYDEVERFEINLINSALRFTGGSQVKAKLLKLKPTTLNAKIKTFKLLTK